MPPTVVTTTNTAIAQHTTISSAVSLWLNGLLHLIGYLSQFFYDIRQHFAWRHLPVDATPCYHVVAFPSGIVRQSSYRPDGASHR